jgi:hypothetical protein
MKSMPKLTLKYRRAFSNSREKFQMNFSLAGKIKQNAGKINVSFDFAVKRDV